MNQAIILYLPVIHQGYLKFLSSYPEVDQVYLLSSELIAEFPQLAKDLRALAPEQNQLALQAILPAKKIHILDRASLAEMKKQFADFILPDEDIMHEFVQKYLADKKTSFSNVFLRWEKQNTLKNQPVQADQTIQQSDFITQMIELAQTEAPKSPDWWRQVGAVAVKDGAVLFSEFNHHVPSSRQAAIEGDPRSNFHKGEHIDLSLALHAEASLIAKAAQQGTALAGAELYVTTFPCPNCAKLIAYSGVQTLYFIEGYAMVDGETILKVNGVKIVKIEEKE
jgi:dCMP deaminase